MGVTQRCRGHLHSGVTSSGKPSLTTLYRLSPSQLSGLGQSFLHVGLLVCCLSTESDHWHLCSTRRHVLGTVCWVLCAGYSVQGTVCWVLCAGYYVLGNACWVLCKVLCAEYYVLGAVCWVLCAGYCVQSTMG